MKKKFVTIIILIFIVFALFVPSASFSQEDNSAYDAAYDTYTLSLEDYQKAHADYVLARSQYLRFKTLKSQEDAIAATREMLTARNNVLLAYLDALRLKLEDADGVTEESSNLQNIKINEEESWLRDHSAKLPSALTLGDLVADSEEAKSRFKTLETLSYETLSIISAGKVYDFRDRFERSMLALRDKVNKIKEEERDEYKLSSDKLTTIDRFLFEAENRKVRGDEKLTQAQTEINKIKLQVGRSSNKYGDVLRILGETTQYLKESTSFMREIIREIKTE